MLALISLAMIVSLSIIDITSQGGGGWRVAAAAKRNKPLISPKPCILETAPLQANFNVTAYMGRWYEIYYKFTEKEKAEDKFFTDYYEEFSANSEKNAAETDTGVFHFNSVYSGRLGERCMSGKGATFVSRPSAPAKLFANRRYNATAREDVEFWVLGTDYQRYTVVYGCVDVVTGSDGRNQCADEHAWVYSRSQNLTDPDALDIVKKLVADVCLDFSSEFSLGNPPTNNTQIYPPCDGANSITLRDSRPIIFGLFVSIFAMTRL